MVTMRQIDEQGIDSDGVIGGQEHIKQVAESLKSNWNGEGGLLTGLAGTAVAITANAAVPDGLAYTDGIQFRMITTAAAGGATTINISSLGAIPVKRRDGSAIKALDWGAGELVKFTIVGSVAYLDHATKLEAASDVDSGSSVIGIVKAHYHFDVFSNTNNQDVFTLQDIEAEAGDLLILPPMHWTNVAMGSKRDFLSSVFFANKTVIYILNTGNYGGGANVQFRVDGTQAWRAAYRGGSPGIFTDLGNFTGDPMVYEIPDDQPHDYSLYIQDNIAVGVQVQIRGAIQIITPSAGAFT
ncbi:hypothetical protein [uncultured Paraglaciecola sp.]|uniref:hypothetical protein n=1 Tax=uncultured Paraglaciecola sp. TaxID=1765024 RepID=UPI00262E1CA1|nr:hypothetical protein [uncultured Paraglaciecola sp.]